MCFHPRRCTPAKDKPLEGLIQFKGREKKNTVTFWGNPTPLLLSYVTQHIECKRVHVYFTSFRSLSLWPALGMKNSFVLSQWCHPHRLSSLSSLKRKTSAHSSFFFVSSQCNRSSNETGSSDERVERDVAVTAALVLTLFWTSGRLTTGSSAERWRVKGGHVSDTYLHLNVM